MEAKTLRIGIIGAGFSGAALAACLHKMNSAQIEVFLFEKSGSFATGEAYRTPYPFHLLNVRARDMSAFEDEPDHFVSWLKTNNDIDNSLDRDLPASEQFAPRVLYGNYLKHLLQTVQSDSSGKFKLNLESSEVIDVIPSASRALLVLNDQRTIAVDKVILASGNNQPQAFPFPVSGNVNRIDNPWDYTAPAQIAKNEPVLIVGTGLSMIDTVLTLHHHQHEGKIYALSRHGLLPLPHAEGKVPLFMLPDHLPRNLRPFIKYIRACSRQLVDADGDWRSAINALRARIPEIWSRTSVTDKKRFLRHVLPYWNSHRHRVHNKIAAMLASLSARQQLNIIAGRVLALENGIANIRLRHTGEMVKINVTWLINCMGPSLTVKSSQQPLEQALVQRGVATPDSLHLGLSVAADGALLNAAGSASTIFYSVGPPRKSACWESGAVPEIRRQCFDLTKQIMLSPVCQL